MAARPKYLAPLALVLVIAGSFLLVLGYLGSFDGRTCVPPTCNDGSCAPPICYASPVLWPTFAGAAIAVAGLALFGAGFLKMPPRTPKTPSRSPSPLTASNDAEAAPKSG